MLDACDRYLDIIHLFYGLSFMIMGVSIVSQLKVIIKSEFRLFEILWLLAWFGILHGVHEFIELFTVVHGSRITYKIINPIFITASYSLLFCFGYKLINMAKKNTLRIRFAAGVVAAFLASVLTVGAGSEAVWAASSRYFFCFTGGLMSAAGFLLYYLSDRAELDELRVGQYFILAAASFTVYAIVGGLVVGKNDFFPASVVNVETFGSVVRIPAQVFRALCAFAMTFSMWKIMDIFYEEQVIRRAKEEDTKRLTALGSLAVTVAHELRNPLAAVRIAAYNIGTKIKDPDIEKHLANIDRKVAESSQIIDNLLVYSQLRPPIYEKVDIGGLIDECADAAKKRNNKAVKMIIGLERLRDPVLDADPVQICEVLNNLLNNAYEAVPAVDGEVKITSEDGDGLVKITIKDNGAGIEGSIISRVFDPFFTSKAKGTGLGLTVCKKIVDMHGGEIAVESVPGKGTSVSVSLPRTEVKK